MYLKKIEAYGFKSFANKTVLEFNQGIMGIVGPNGSGKSNVADAVRWVLGEQSAKQLRGSNMQDVIFAGTENRKPQGYASVTLTIDNRDHMLAVDFDEVTVARRVYRSGESEYLLNGQLCRLRDVQELFYDTGVGKEGYSIIGQGQIDRILSNKPEDRRELFDEAAGIVKFKKRKIITQRKLETEEGNLSRVTDILTELEKQVGPLERQSEKARQYLRLRDEQKTADLQAFRLETGDYRRRLSEAERNKQIVDEELAGVRAEADSMKERYDTLTERLGGLEQEISRLQAAISESRVRREELTGRTRILREQIQAAQTNEQTVRDRIDRLDTDAAEHQREYLTLREQKRELVQSAGAKEAEADSLEQELSGLQEELHRLEARQAQLQEKRVHALNEKAELRAGLERTQTMAEQAESRLSELGNLSQDSQEERQAIARKIRESREEMERLAKEEKEQKQRFLRAGREGEECEKRLRNTNSRLAQASQRYSGKRSQRDALLNLAERYEGYGSSIRRVMEKKSTEPGIRGVVADLFHTRQEYETAIETALGGRIQNIVTDTERTAKNLVRYLKENRYGRATFLPLESVKGREGFPKPDALREEGAIGVAADLVETDGEYREISRFLLGRYLVVDQIDHALAIAAKYRYSLSLVTLEGELLSPGGAITGGSYKNNSNLLGRRRELEELAEACRQLKKQIEDCRTEAASLEEEIRKKAEEREDAQQQLHQLDLSKNTVSMELGRSQDQETLLRENLHERENEEKELRGRLAVWMKERKEVLGKLEAIDRDLVGWEVVSDKTAARLEEARAELEAQTEALAALRQDMASITQRTEFLTENQERILREREQMLTEIATLTESVEGGSHFAEEKEAEIAALEEEIARTGTTCADMEAAFAGQSAEKEQVSAEQQSIFGEREELNERMTKLDRESFRLQNSAERLTDAIAKQVDYIWNEYEMTPSEAEQAGSAEEEISLTEIRKRVSGLRQQIRELGPVNVNAIEEYKEVAERYTFLKAQHTDLVEAAESLKKIIRDLENGMRKQFRENFARIQAEFERVFHELFGGGKGRLELAEADDLLEAGVIINAQPPGKKLQNMMQLSGGEKALTAIALLFAIQNLKPSPFCLLDEIEAALDEPNVDRYAAYLDRLKGHTQFIVITHRRGTMEIADRLYGITMQEKGVSALVSVDLTDPALTE